MQVDVNPELDQVVLRHTTEELALRVGALVVVGVGVPLWVRATVPGLVVPSLLVTAGLALWAVTAMTAVLVLDDVGVEVGAGRRSRRRVAWDQIAAIELARVHVVVRTASGRQLDGPAVTAATLEDALRAAWELGVLPTRLHDSAGDARN